VITRSHNYYFRITRHEKLNAFDAVSLRTTNGKLLRWVCQDRQAFCIVNHTDNIQCPLKSPQNRGTRCGGWIYDIISSVS